MGLYKLCKHKGRAMDRCSDPWWGSFQYKGKLYRESLARWANEAVRTKAQADAVFDRMCDAIRSGKFAKRERGDSPRTFDELADLYIVRYVDLKGLRSKATIEYRLRLLRRTFGKKAIGDIKVADVEDMVQDLKAAGKKPATVKRHLALLRAMLNWAVEREYLDRNPFRRGSQAVIKLERENNRRDARLTEAQETALLEKADGNLRALIILALETGMRRGEMLKLTCGDVDLADGSVRVRAENAKSKRERKIPVESERLKGVLKWLKLGSDGTERPPEASLFVKPCGSPLRSFRNAWVKARKDTVGADFRFHDLRGECASRLTEANVPLSQVRDILGHASIVTTERYDRQKFDTLRVAAKRLDTGKSFKIPSSAVSTEETQSDCQAVAVGGKKLRSRELRGGAGGGGRTHTSLRTRDFESRASASFTTPARGGERLV